MSAVLFRDEVYAIVGAAIEVHRELGSGFLEAVYQEALEIELERRGVPLESQKHLVLYYKGKGSGCKKNISLTCSAINKSLSSLKPSICFQAKKKRRS